MSRELQLGVEHLVLARTKDDAVVGHSDCRTMMTNVSDVSSAQ
jgi:hypothetical protein